MSATVVEITGGAEHARVTLRAGTIVPRLVARGRSSARVALVAGGALLLGGDAIDLRIVVAAGCSLDLEDIGGTVAYDGEGEQATWDATVHVGDGASLTWHGLPFVVADGADVDRRTVLHLGRGASALLRETVVLGRTGEPGGAVRSRLIVDDEDGPVLVERVDLDGRRPVPGVLGGERILDTVLAVGAHVGPAGAGPGTTVLELERGGVVVRSIGTHAHAADLADVWNDTLVNRAVLR